MKRSEYAQQMGVRYETAWRWFRDAKIQGRCIGLRTSIVYSFCARIYGQRRAKRKAEVSVRELEAKEEGEGGGRDAIS